MKDLLWAIIVGVIAGVMGFLILLLFKYGDLPFWDLSVSASFNQLERKLMVIYLLMLLFSFIILMLLKKTLNIIKALKNHYKIEINAKGILKYWRIFDDYSMNERNKKIKITLIIIGYVALVMIFFINTSTHYDLKIPTSFMQLETKIAYIYVVMIGINIFVLESIYDIYKIIKEINITIKNK